MLAKLIVCGRSHIGTLELMVRPLEEVGNTVIARKQLHGKYDVAVAFLYTDIKLLQQLCPSCMHAIVKNELCHCKKKNEVIMVPTYLCQQLCNCLPCNASIVHAFVD